jgi:hypothetical protein
MPKAWLPLDHREHPNIFDLTVCACPGGDQDALLNRSRRLERRFPANSP